MELDRLIEQLNITHDMARRWCGKTPRQWRRYRAGDSPFPVPLRQLVMLRAGFLGAVSPAWTGWTLTGDTLTSPEGHRYDLAWFHGLPWYLQRLRAERAQLRQRIRELERVPIPANVVPFPRQKKGA